MTYAETVASLIGSNNIDKAAIFAADGSSVWASSPGFVVRHIHYPTHFAEISGGRDGAGSTLATWDLETAQDGD